MGGCGLDLCESGYGQKSGRFAQHKQDPKNEENFATLRRSVNFSRGKVLHGNISLDIRTFIIRVVI
jgi:hypothetical protein